MSLLSKVRDTLTAQSELILDQQADDGTDRILIKDSAGTNVAEIFHDGTNNVINPLTGNVDVQGALATESLKPGGESDAPELANERVEPELSIRPSGGDSVGSAAVYPRGTVDRTHFITANDPDYQNHGAVKYELDGADALIEAYTKGTGGTDPTSLEFRGFGDGLTIGGSKDIPGVPGTSSSVSPGFDTWRQASADRPVYVEIRALAQTDGTSNGIVDVQVDESGGTTSDYTMSVVYTPSELGSGAAKRGSHNIALPAGAQYQINNASDPSGGNSISNVREFVL